MRWPGRIAACVLALALVLGATTLTHPEPTEAAFTDAEVAGGALGAHTMPAPNVTSCTVQTLLNLGIVFQGVTIVWKSTYDINHVRLAVVPTRGAAVTVGSGNITVTGPVSGEYTYTAVLTQGLLQNLLGNLLGGGATLSVTELRPNTSWVSPATTRILRITALGGLLGNTCTAP